MKLCTKHLSSNAAFASAFGRAVAFLAEPTGLSGIDYESMASAMASGGGDVMGGSVPSWYYALENRRYMESILREALSGYVDRDKRIWVAVRVWGGPIGEVADSLGTSYVLVKSVIARMDGSLYAYCDAMNFSMVEYQGGGGHEV